MELVRVPSPFATGVLDCSTKASAVTGAATCISLQSDMGKSQKLVDTSECLLWVPAYCTHTHTHGLVSTCKNEWTSVPSVLSHGFRKTFLSMAHPI